MKNILIGAVGAAVIIGGVYWFMQTADEPEADTGAMNTVNGTDDAADASRAGDATNVQDDKGGVTADAVSEHLVGTWQSTQDPKSVRVFKANDVVEDWYDGELVWSGLWVAFEKLEAPEVPHPLEDGEVYMQMTATGAMDDTLNFRVAAVSETNLELVYLDRGGVLAYERVDEAAE